MLAAIDRSVRHRERETTPSWEVYAHLGFPNRSGGARAARRQLTALTEAGALERSRRHGIEVWSLTPAGERRLRAAGAVELPESPQHAAWRTACALAGQEIERFTDETRTALTDALALIDSGTPARSDALFEAADRVEFVVSRLGSASYCLYEWPLCGHQHKGHYVVWLVMLSGSGFPCGFGGLGAWLLGIIRVPRGTRGVCRGAGICRVWCRAGRCARLLVP